MRFYILRERCFKIHYIAFFLFLQLSSTGALGYTLDTLRIQSAQNMPPYEFRDESGDVIGYNIDLFNEITHRLRCSYLIQLGSREEIIQNLNNRKIDLATGILTSDTCAKGLFFSKPYGTIRLCCMVRKGCAIHSFEDLCGKRILVQTKSIAHEWLQKEPFGGKIHSIDCISEGVLLLAAGHYDAVVCGEAVGKYTIDLHALSNLQLFPLNRSPYQLTYISSDSGLIAQINPILETLQKENIFPQLYKKWFIKPTPNRLDSSLYFIGGFLLLAVFLGFTLAALWKKRVKTAIGEIEDKNRKIALAISGGNLSIIEYDILHNRISYISGNVIPPNLTKETALTLIHPHDRVQLLLSLQSIIAGEEQATPFICRAHLREDTIYWEHLQFSFMGVKNKTGVVESILGTIKSLTKEKQQEELRVELTNSLQIAITASDLFIWRYDLHNKELTILQEKRFISTQHPIDQFFEFIHPEDTENFRRLFQNVVSGISDHEHISARIFNKKKNRYDFYENIVSGLRDSSGELYCLIGTQKDITAEKEKSNKQEQLIQSLDMAMDAGKIIAWHYSRLEKCYTILYGLDNSLISAINSENYDQFIHPDDKPSYVVALNELLQKAHSGASWVVRLKFPGKKEYIPYEVSVKTECDDQGKIVSLFGIHKDISESYLLQQKLNEKINLFAAIYNNIPAGILFYDETGSLQYTNRSFFSMLSIARTEIEPFIRQCNIFTSNDVPKPVIDSLTQKQPATSLFNLAEVRQKNKILATHSTRKEGYFESHYSPVCDQEGNIFGYIAIINDITERIERQQRLEELQDYIALALESSETSVWVYDAKEQIFNTIYGNTLVGSGSSLIENLNLLHPKDHVTLLEAINEIVTGRKEKNTIITRYKVDCEWHYFKSHLMGKKEKGVIRFIAGTQQDITKNILAEKELEDSKRKMEIAIKTSGVALWEYNVHSGLYSSYNDPLNNFNQNESFGTNDYLRYIHPDDLDIARKACEKIELGTDLDICYNVRMQFPGNKEWHYCSISGTPIEKKDNGKVLRYAGLKRDITSLIEIQISLEKEKERALLADRLKSAFLANMSHEIRTPLNAIVGFSELLVNTDNQQEKKEYAKIISNNNELLLRLIGDILDLSKIESGLTVIKSEEFDFAPFFDEFTQSLSLRVTSPDVKYIAVNHYSHCIVTLDKNRMAQILTNFATNAIKYTPKGSIEIGYEAINDGIRVYVKDTGIGISKEKQHRVFQRFEKLDSFAQGTGLGLSICKAIVDAQNGRIGFESKEGEGSLFWAWIGTKTALVEKDELLTHAHTEATLPQDLELDATLLTYNYPGIPVLVAEDNDSNFKLIHSLLKNIPIERAVNGVEAVSMSKTKTYSAILMDIRMPEMDGLTATREIRRFNTLIPIIAVTADAFDSNQSEAFEAGCNGFLAKPISGLSLLQCMIENGLY